MAAEAYFFGEGPEGELEMTALMPDSLGTLPGCFDEDGQPIVLVESEEGMGVWALKVPDTQEDFIDPFYAYSMNSLGTVAVGEVFAYKITKVTEDAVTLNGLLIIRDSDNANSLYPVEMKPLWVAGHTGGKTMREEFSRS